ncbi:MAG TPA: nickel-binding protein [Steroidobacteraceae bacterium]|nr:nickel-binding protein [Steroidobacteraceae bacterium]
MMKAIAAATAMTIGAGSVSALAVESAPVQHRYLIERTFPEGALDGVDATVKAKVNANNKSLGVGWEKSYANANKTKTYCVYNAPNENAVREAAKLNGLPIDNIVEVPLSFKAEPMSAVQKIATGNHRFLVTRRSDVAFHDVNDEKFGVRLITSYLTQDKHNSYSIYEGPDFASIEKAAKASGAPFEAIAEIPETLYPR